MILYILQGCLPRLCEALRSNTSTVILVLILVVTMEMVLIILAVCLCALQNTRAAHKNILVVRDSHMACQYDRPWDHTQSVRPTVIYLFFYIIFYYIITLIYDILVVLYCIWYTGCPIMTVKDYELIALALRLEDNL